MQLRHIQSINKLISLFKVFGRFSTGSHNHVHSDKSIRHHLFYLPYFRSKKSSVITTAHYSERPGTQALKIEYVVSPEEKHQRSQRLLTLSDQKTQAFYARHIGQVMPVLMEKSKTGVPMHGFTENYIRVEVENDDSLDNRVVNVRLGDFNEERTALKSTILI